MQVRYEEYGIICLTAIEAIYYMWSWLLQAHFYCAGREKKINCDLVNNGVFSVDKQKSIYTDNSGNLQF